MNAIDLDVDPLLIIIREKKERSVGILEINILRQFIISWSA